MAFKERELHIVGAPRSIRPSWYERYDLLFTAIIRNAVMDYADILCNGEKVKKERKNKSAYPTSKKILFAKIDDLTKEGMESWFRSDTFSIFTRVDGNYIIRATNSFCEEREFDWIRVRKDLKYIYEGRDYDWGKDGQ